MSLDLLSSWLNHWPAADRRLLEMSLEGDDFQDEEVAFTCSARAARWSDASLANNVRFYTYWLQFLARRNELDPTARPSTRVTKERLSAYVKELRRVSPITRATYVRGIRNMLVAIDPKGDRARLNYVVRRLVSTAKPSRDQNHLLVSPSDMFYAGIRLMERVSSMAERDVRFAIKYRDGLMMSAIVCKALRKRNFARMLLGENITRNVMDVYEVRFRPLATKSRRQIRSELSSKLTPYFDHWLGKIRPSLLKGRSSDAIWITLAGTDMSPETFYVCFCKVTKKELGSRINPHLTRKIVATGIAIARPELVRMVGSLLDQTTDQSAAYNLADQLSASRTYLDLLEKRRQQALDSVARSTGQKRRRHR